MKMKSLFLGLMVLSQLAFAENVSITHKDSYNGYATVAGKISSENANSPYLITVKNGGLTYSTVSDGAGVWAIVFRHRSTQFDVTAKPLSVKEEDSNLIEHKTEFLPLRTFK